MQDERVLPPAEHGRPAEGSLRVLVVEDDFLIGQALAATLTENGFAVVGPVGLLEDALALAKAERLDGALLDVGLGGRSTSIPIAQALAERSIPFIFLTGYDDAVAPADLRGRPFLAKPVAFARVAEMIRAHFLR